MSQTDRNFQPDLSLPEGFVLPQELRARRNGYGLWAVVRHFVPMIALLAAAPFVWTHLSAWATLLLVPFLGLGAYKLTIIMHDCAHNSLFENRLANKYVGTVAGWVLASNYKTFAENHWAHHRLFGEKDDPQGPDYLGLLGMSRSQIVLQLLRPLAGYNLYKLRQFAPELPDADAPAAKGAPSGARLLWGFVVPVLLIQGLIATLVSGGWAYPLLAALLPASAATFGLFFSQLRGFCEHVAGEGDQERGCVRTHLPNMFDRFFFYSLNFNYHVEHHLLPHVPSCHLPAIYSLIRDKVHTKDTVSNSLLATIKHRLDACPR